MTFFLQLPEPDDYPSPAAKMEVELHGPLPEIDAYYIWGEDSQAPDVVTEICRVTKVAWASQAEEWFVYSTGNRERVRGDETFNDLSRWNEMTRKLDPAELSL